MLLAFKPVCNRISDNYNSWFVRCYLLYVMRMLLDPSLLYSLIFGVSLGSYANEVCDYKSYLIFACSRIVLLYRLKISDGVFLCGSKELP